MKPWLPKVVKNGGWTARRAEFTGQRGACFYNLLRFLTNPARQPKTRAVSLKNNGIDGKLTG